ncbi:TetR family transcriptional regulator [Asanoa ferruginea]|uniref:TetR family transcriptional regulator n=1 Tax=Asanoa ferruginea TaxID=53367 RepID=A0A3D9ZY62_9ACTN|nr:TetR family transcriptional regulator [Asanoa ferruginea]REG02062.1 TetR family transcriptional regulator [Asanoa ferruginea]GIF53682.1 TetR family transcriptional regulator [Asanoa ferruginea]
MVRRTGRRPGNPDTRDAILGAARTAFAEKGFDGASIRHIATVAGVDPALVHHYFGTKDKLFLAAMNSPIDPSVVIPEALAGDPDLVGERLVRFFLGIWDSPAGKAGVAMLRSAVSSEWTARLFREFVVSQVLRRVRAVVPLRPEEAQMRVSLVASQLAGLAMARYVIKVEPLASAPPEVLVAAIGPTIQRYVFGDLPGVWPDS